MESEWRNSFTGPCSKPNPNFPVMHSVQEPILLSELKV